MKGGYFPLFSYGFIVLNIAVFVLQLSSPGMLVGEYAAVPAEIQRGENWPTLLTSMFLHGSFGHLLGNMLFLWVFADNIEATVGNFRFLIFYLLGGMAAHVGHIYFNMGSIVPTVGASGAISAVMGAYLVMFPASRIKLWFFFFIFRVPAFIFLGIWIYMQWSSGWTSIQEGGSSGGVAWWAHIGGFVFGAAAGLYFRSAYPMERVEEVY